MQDTKGSCRRRGTSTLKILHSNQIEAVDNTFFKDQDSRMATKQVYERKSKTTFGKDS